MFKYPSWRWNPRVSYVKENYKTENVDYIAIWRNIFRLEAVEWLTELCLTFAVANAKSETGFSHMKRVEKHDSTKAVKFFLQQKKIGRKLTMNENNLGIKQNWKSITAYKKILF